MSSNQLKFPLKEVVKDFADRKRSFTIDLYEPPIGGYLLVAKEEVKKESNNGYQFESYSESNIGVAFASLRKKIKRQLSIRYLEISGGKNYPRNDEMVGRVGYGGVIVDGIFIEFEELSEILQSYEGFQFKLSIFEKTDEIV